MLLDCAQLQKTAWRRTPSLQGATPPETTYLTDNRLHRNLQTDGFIHSNLIESAANT
jgi:hypothetical protein